MSLITKGFIRIIQKQPRLFLFLLLFCGIALTTIPLYLLSKDVIEKAALSDARIYSKAIQEFRKQYSSQVVDPLIRQGLIASHDYLGKDNTIPLPATFSMKLAEELNKNAEGRITRLLSPYPFPWREETGGLRSPFEKRAWDALVADPNKAFYLFDEENGQKILRYATADKMTNSCVSCHNSHPETPKSNWIVGDVRGILELTIPLNVVLNETRATLWKSSVSIVGMVGLILGFLAVIIYQFRQNNFALIESNKQVSDHMHELEQVNDDLKRFTSVASHDLKAPLRNIGSLANFIEQDMCQVEREKVSKHIVQLKSKLENMDKLIDGLIAYTRFSGSDEQAGILDLNFMISKLKDFYSDEKVEIIVPTDLPAVWGMKSQIKQVFNNLIGNAIRFNQGERKTVRLSFVRAHDYIRFEVADNGPGISEENHSRVFEMFRTGESTGEKEIQGMGLAIVKKIIERHRGRIWIESSDLGGAAFVFVWPNSEEER